MADSLTIRIDTSQIKKMARDLEETVPGSKKAVVEALKQSGLGVAMEARALSSWSSRIPSSIRVAGGLNKIVVRAGSARAPHAAPYEHQGSPGTFRHPVFGHDVWVGQAARPFLGPALARKGAEVEEILLHKVDEVFRERGF